MAFLQYEISHELPNLSSEKIFFHTVNTHDSLPHREFLSGSLSGPKSESLGYISNSGDFSPKHVFLYVLSIEIFENT